MLPAIGYAIREQNREILSHPSITGGEITFERADDPLRVESYLRGLEFEHTSIHSLKMSLASADLVADRYLEGIRMIAEENGARSVSDHLGFTRDANQGIEMGHFAAPPYSGEALDRVCRNIDKIQTYFKSMDFYVENVAYLFRFKAEMEEIEFLVKVLTKSGCGWLLDIANLHANAQNFGYDPREFIRVVTKAAPKMQIHLAGGEYSSKEEFYFDTHSQNLPQEVKELYEYAIQEASSKVTAVFIERDQNFPEDMQEWITEIETVRAITENVLLNTGSSQQEVSYEPAAL